ncbi:putative nitrogen fixation protein NifT [Bradyrhizobium sp. 160]|nr:putative nitrogen fixation protein NifT [Bradyrhizobium sp. 160]MCK1623401.1 putative nitrogen fixation protein NifT [Bradyrhizobium sp. 160]
MKLLSRRSLDAGLSQERSRRADRGSEYETLWGGWIRMANGWMLDLPEMASDTPLPITINARTRGKTGGLMKALPRIEFVNAADAKANSY